MLYRGHVFLEHILASFLAPISQIRRQRERIRSANMTDEQRNERNKKQHEAFKRKKDDTHNKENVPGNSIVPHGHDHQAKWTRKNFSTLPRLPSIQTPLATYQMVT
ncbi:hypothetical protein C2845_PM15G02640 [Panicum miliaceum]|uniref:Uncharacterized protein n=1 Tax=Panicum miliaceum TaxID=4540 RepID=A0A3L6QAZ8_PANMI|nr:hypothetical protein C2845_PM15G02640 [Panicum miliaceum]